MLGAKFVEQFVLDFGQVGVGLAGNGNCSGLAFGGMCFNEVLQGVVVDIICIIENRGVSIPAIIFLGVSVSQLVMTFGDRRRGWEKEPMR